MLVQTSIFAGVPRTPSVFLIVFTPAGRPGSMPGKRLVGKQCGLPLEGGDGGDGGEPPRRSLSPGWRSGVLLGPSVLLVFEMPRPRLPRPSCGQRFLEFEQRLRKDREDRDDDSDAAWRLGVAPMAVRRSTPSCTRGPDFGIRMAHREGPDFARTEDDPLDTDREDGRAEEQRVVRLLFSYGAKADSIGRVNYTLLADGTRVYEGGVYDGTRVYLADSPYSA